MGIYLPELVEGLTAAHAGHDHVQYHKVDLPLVRRIDLDGVPAAGSLETFGLAAETRASLYSLEDHRFIINEEDRLASVRPSP